MNQLRISHESLDMDDIISDLNPSANHSELVKDELPSSRTDTKKPSGISKQDSKIVKETTSKPKSSGYGPTSTNKAKQLITEPAPKKVVDDTKENKNLKNMQSYSSMREQKQQSKSGQIQT